MSRPLAGPMAALAEVELAEVELAQSSRPAPDLRKLLDRIRGWLRDAATPSEDEREEVAAELELLAAAAGDEALAELAIAVRAWDEWRPR